MNNYLEFLIDLWQITKEDGGFKAYAPLISKHKVNKSISAVLCEDLEWVSDAGALYVWEGKKPTKKDAVTAELMVKSRIANNKKENAKAKPVVKNVKTKAKKENLKKTAKEIKDLGNAIDSLSDAVLREVPYTEDKLKNDVKNILEESVEETTVYKRIYNLEQELAKSQVQLQTERKISFDEIDRLLASVKSLEDQVSNLNIINSDLRNELLLKNSVLELRQTEISQLNGRLNTCIPQLDATTKELNAIKKELAEANAKLNNTIKNKIKSWFRK